MRSAVFFLSFLPLMSCATLTTGTAENIVIGSSPSAADATLVCGGRPVGNGVTPTTIRIRRNAGDCRLHITKEGFSDETIAIEQGVNPAYWTNFIFSPLAPSGAYVLVAGNSQEKVTGAAMLMTAAVIFATDFWTGASHTHRPSKVDVTLRPRR